MNPHLTLDDSMKELIKKILLLLNLSLTKEEWDELSLIVSNLPEKNMANFQAYFSIQKDNKPPIHSNNTKLINYMTSWFQITQDITQWLKKISADWQDLTHKALDADTMLPLIIELLPTDISQLKLILAKLDQAALLNDNGEQGYAITMLHSATTVKVSGLHNDDTLFNNEISYVANEINKRELVVEIYPVCLELQAYVLHRFIETLKLQDTETYQKYLSPDKVFQIDALITDNGQIEISSFKIDELQLCLQKYLYVTEMCYSLGRKNSTATNILLEFSAKFELYEAAMPKPIKTMSGYLATPISYLFGWKSAEERFMQLAAMIAQQNSMENQELDINKYKIC